ncbi:MAG: hypothetical protein H0X15_06610 [Acidobacteria bacterium]|nr:hypothetical protein [Acidobacteriota bacterium]
MQTECLLESTEETTLDIKVRFLHLVSREIGKLETPLIDLPTDVEPDFQLVQTLEAGGQLFQTWQEAVEREVNLPTFSFSDISHIRQQDFSFPTTRGLEPLRDENEQIVGVIIRTQQEIFGVIELQVEEVSSQQLAISSQKLFKLTVRVKNLTALENAKEQSRDDALLHSLVSTHTILSATDGEFVSLLEPPDELREAVAACRNTGTYPVLAGTDGTRDCMLSSPIILYDYPQIAAESAGDLFDGAEIDEILTLRIMTMTDEEKHEMRGIDDRVRKILERTETMSEEQLLKMHGAMRGLVR